MQITVFQHPILSTVDSTVARGVLGSVFTVKTVKLYCNTKKNMFRRFDSCPRTQITTWLILTVSFCEESCHERTMQIESVTCHRDSISTFITCTLSLTVFSSINTRVTNVTVLN